VSGPPSDVELLAAARAGDRGALEALLERHEAQVYRFGMKMCRDPEDAKDVLQETLLAVARGVRDFRSASSVSTWLFPIARIAAGLHPDRSARLPGGWRLNPFGDPGLSILQEEKDGDRERDRMDLRRYREAGPRPRGDRGE